MTEQVEMKGRNVILIAAMVTSFMTTFMSSAMNLSIPSLEEYFGVGATTISWVVSAYTISIAMMSLPMGRFADLTDYNRVFISGISWFGILSVICIMTTNVWMLVLIRFLQGGAAAMIFATNNSILIRSYPLTMKGRVLGGSVAATYVGLTLGPVLGGQLQNSFGWKSIFVASLLTSVAAFAMAIRSVQVQKKLGLIDANGRTKDWKKPEGGILTHADPMGALLYMGGIFCSLFGMMEMSVLPAAKYLFALGVLLIVIFFITESKLEKPLMRVTLFTGSRAFTFSNLAALLNYASTFAISYIMSIYLQVVMHIPSNKAGMLMIAMPAIQALLSPTMGRLSDRVRPAILASGGMGVCAAMLVLFSRIHEGTPLAYIICIMGVTGLGFAMFSSPNTNAIMSCVKPSEYGIANSIISTMRTYGQSSGLAILNIVTGIMLGTGSLSAAPVAEIISVIHVAFLLFAGLCDMGLVFSLIRNK